ncbi:MULTISPECIES: YraN family protein [unclassified Campylobacter]|uniref:YraN family protein n=1 Tax=unclassified Campylobacter TaxID=2593542 RepID=UPI0022E9B69F|nr:MULTISPECIES: YraN family protein [unclassified Campylobacter]MDA3079329.1 YraN family protein [Campylobacter sp. CS_NA2]MDA3080368.1 YraN family protein [Campylobacter sp. CS_NA1]MDA3085428.1 YraN family protein [Campylobacter sp. CS_ED1]MDA3091035.1 YraN family protein [Campylobacter sp. CS_ED2]WBR51261.1 YraN family protein [Campylobacter sp. CS_NA3]
MGLKEYIFGFSAESKACEFLQNHGFTILCRNFHSRFGEIDIIAKKDEILHFIEVKATLGEYETAYRLTKSKFEKILKTINFFMMKENFSNEFQIDFLGISKNSVNFIENISAN